MNIRSVMAQWGAPLVFALYSTATLSQGASTVKGGEAETAYEGGADRNDG